MSDQNINNQHKHLSESHSQNPFDLARENQDFQREYDNAQEFYRKRPFVERFKKYIPWTKGLQGLGHTFSALSLGAGGIFTVYNYLFSDSQITDFQTWLFVGIGVVIFILVVLAIEAGKGHFLAAAMKNKFEAANDLLGEKKKPALRKWAFTLVALSLVGSVFFGMMGTYYLATEKVEINTGYQAEIDQANEQAQQADNETKSFYDTQIQSKYSQVEQIKTNIVNSCPSCYTMRQRMQNQINDIQESITQLEEKRRKALADNKDVYAADLQSLEDQTSTTLDQDSKKAMGRGWILGVLTLFSDLMIVFCVWFIALYNDRLLREGKHIGAINEERMPTFSIEAIYANEMMQKHVQFLQMGGANLLLNGGGNNMLFPTNQVFSKDKKKKRKKSKKKGKNIVQNPIGFHTFAMGKTDIDFEAKNEEENETQNEDSNNENSPKFDDSAEKEKGKNNSQFYGKNMLMNLNPETPYNLAKKYDMSKSEKQKLAQVRKVYMNFVKKEGKRPLLSELSGACGKSPNTVKKYVQMMEKDGQELLRRRGERM